jgi:hypothetical protein
MCLFRRCPNRYDSVKGTQEPVINGLRIRLDEILDPGPDRDKDLSTDGDGARGVAQLDGEVEKPPSEPTSLKRPLRNSSKDGLPDASRIAVSRSMYPQSRLLAAAQQQVLFPAPDGPMTAIKPGARLDNSCRPLSP